MCQGCQNKVVKNVAYRVDHVGSFLRPKELVEAREKFSKGELSQEELTKVEDKAITELVEKQIANGLKGVTAAAEGLIQEYYLLEQDIYQIEVLANLDQVPATGALISIAYPNWTEATGSPVRVVAILPEDE